MGPVVDIELEDPQEKVPPGVVFGIKHFLTVPNSFETPETERRKKKKGKSGESGHRHSMIKLTKRNGKHELEEIDYTTNISSQYFTTTKFAGGSLCKITSACLRQGTFNKCSYSSLKKLIITTTSRCPHERHSLYLWCVCRGSEKEFEKAIKERGEQKTTVIKEFKLEKSAAYTYNISVRLSGNRETDWDTRCTSHEKMCERNGVVELATQDHRSGYIKGKFGCKCDSDSPQHCKRAAAIDVKIEEKKGEHSVVYSHDTTIGCQTGKEHTSCNTDREALERVLKKEIPQTHRPGDFIEC